MHTISLHGESVEGKRFELFINTDSREAAASWLEENGFRVVGYGFRRNRRTTITCGKDNITTLAVWADISEAHDPAAVQFVED